MQSRKNILINLLLGFSFVLAYLVMANVMNDNLRISHIGIAFAGGTSLFIFGFYRKSPSSKK